MSEDIEIFRSCTPDVVKEKAKEPVKEEATEPAKKFSNLLQPSDALVSSGSRYQGLRHARSMETLATTPTKEQSFLSSKKKDDSEDNIDSVNPWEEDEKISGMIYTLKVHSFNRHTHYIIACQVIIIGDAGVGKTSLIHQLTKKRFNKIVMPTLGVDFSAKNLHISDAMTIRLHLWDVAGQERYRCLSRAYLKGCQVLQ